MFRTSLRLGVTLATAVAALVSAGNDDVTFRSDVSLVRVDVQVRDSTNHPISGLKVTDFVLKEQGKAVPIRSFATEEIPLDVLLLLDVSGSMRPHVERVASASRQALDALGNEDRVAIMVFDRVTRVRMEFKDNHDAIVSGLYNVLRQEGFNGGTDILRGMMDAIDYLTRHGRKEARRAVIILTDDQTGGSRNDDAVLSALNRADAVMSSLLAADATQQQFPGGGRRAPTQWPGGGGGGGWGSIIWGGRVPSSTPMPPGGGGRFPGPLNGGMQSGGTAEISEASGGDSMPVNDASALQTTLARLRQRYALHFLSPPDARPGQQRSIEVVLAESAAVRYPYADLRFRRGYRAEGGSPAETGNTEETVVVQAPAAGEITTGQQPSTPTSEPQAPALKRRPVVVDDSRGPRGPNPAVGSPAPSKANATETPARPQITEVTPATPAEPVTSTSASTQPRKGWRNVDEPEPSIPDPTPAKPVKKN